MATGGRGRRRIRQARLAVVGVLAVLALLAAACDPAPPPPPDTGTTADWSSWGTPSSTSPTSPSGAAAPAAPADGTAGPDAVGPNGPGGAWRASLVSDLSDLCATASESTGVSTAADGTLTSYVALSEGPDGTPAVHTFRAGSEEQRQATVAAIEQQSGPVLSVEIDGEVSALAIDDPLYVNGQQWWIDRVAYPTAWGASPPLAQGAGVRVAVVDTGVDGAHPDLTPAVVHGQDFVTCGGDAASDPNGHGTHVAGIVGARDNTIGGIGGAPAVTIVPVRVLGSGGGGSISAVAAGIIWAADPAKGNADIMNLSLGSPAPSQVLADALQYALDQGVTIVAAGGNECCPTPPAVSYPAAYSLTMPGIIAVAATDTTNQHAAFSNIGSYITIAAPGVGIVSTLPANAYGSKSGTSMASPTVAAAAALLKAKCPGYTPVQVRNRLTSTAQDLGTPGADTSFGAGLVRADLALAQPC